MDTPFIYDKHVTGRYFIGRRSECMVLGNLLRAGEHVFIYEPPKTGKKSLIHQTLYNLRNDGLQFSVSFVDMLIRYINKNGCGIPEFIKRRK